MFSTVEEILKELQEYKKPFILVDSKYRENEGDIVIPAELVTKQLINFMITHCRGVLCVCITDALAKKLELDLIKRSEEKSNCAYFTTTIEAKYGITTGISAADRALTISLLTKQNVQKSDFCTPGHVFPLIINKNGLSGRAGHTEGSATFIKLAGFQPVSVICEILDENGDSAKNQYLQNFAAKHNLKIATIESLQEYLDKKGLNITF